MKGNDATNTMNANQGTSATDKNSNVAGRSAMAGPVATNPKGTSADSTSTNVAQKKADAANSNNANQADTPRPAKKRKADQLDSGIAEETAASQHQIPKSNTAPSQEQEEPAPSSPPKQEPFHQHGQKFFTLRQGRTNKGGCIFLHRQDLLRQVDAFEGAEYMVFDTLDSAYRYLARAEINDAEDDEFERQYSGLVSHYRLYGTSDVPVHTELGQFATRMRAAHSVFMKGKPGPLTQERLDRLKEIEFTFGGTRDRKRFHQWVGEIVSYRERNGGRDPPENTLLRKWITKIRCKYLNFKRTNEQTPFINASKCEELEKVGFDWTEGGHPDTDLNASKDETSTNDDGMGGERLEQLHVVDMVEDGNSNSVSETSLQIKRTEDTLQGPNDMGRFLAEVLGTSSSATDQSSKVARSSAIIDPVTGYLSSGVNAFSTSTSNAQSANAAAKISPSPIDVDADWYQMFISFRAVYPNGNAANASSVNIAGTPLHEWILAQQEAYTDFITRRASRRRKHPDGTPLLTNEQIDMLKAVRFDLKESDTVPKKTKKKKWLVQDATWNQKVQEITAFKEANGHTMPPFKSHTDLREWVNSVQREYKLFTDGEPSALTMERVDTLKAIGFKFERHRKDSVRTHVSTKTKSWDDHFEELLEFQRQYDHTRVPGNIVGLGSWTIKQREACRLFKQNKKSKLTAEQASRLEQIGFEYE